MFLAGILAALALAAISGIFILRLHWNRERPETRSHFFPVLFSFWIVAVVVWNTYFFSFKIPGLFDISIERVAFSLLCLAAAYQILFQKVRLPEGRQIELQMIIFLALCIASMALNGFGSKYPHTPKPWFIFFTGYFEPFMAFFFIRNFFTNAQDVKFLLSTLFMLGVYLCFTAIMERYDINALIFPAYITDKTILLHLDRSRGPFLNAAFNGLAMTVSFVAGVFLLPLLNPVRRLLVLVLLPLFGVGVFFTFTRSAYLVFLLTLATLVFFYRSKTPTWKLTPLLLTLCLIGVLVNSDRLFSDKRSAGGIVQMAEVNIRFQLIAKSLRLIQENPVFGVGLAHFSVVDASAIFQDNQHNHLIGMAAELGIIGLAAYLSLLATVFRKLYALADNPRISRNAWANAVILLTLGITVCLVNNIFVEASLCPFINTATFTFAGLAALLTDRPDILDAAL